MSLIHICTLICTYSQVQKASEFDAHTSAVENFVDFTFLTQWTLVTTTAFVPKDVAIKINLLLYWLLNVQTDM